MSLLVITTTIIIYYNDVKWPHRECSLEIRILVLYVCNFIFVYNNKSDNIIFINHSKYNVQFHINKNFKSL